MNRTNRTWWEWYGLLWENSFPEHCCACTLLKYNLLFACLLLSCDQLDWGGHISAEEPRHLSEGIGEKRIKVQLT